MRKSAILVSAGCAAFLLTLVAGVPAGAMLHWLAPGSVQARGVSGTLWQGSARGLDMGSLRLGETRWDLSLAPLFRARLGGYAETRLGDASASGDFSLGSGGQFDCNGCRYEGTLAALRPWAPALRQLDGRVLVEIESMEVADGWPRRIIGAATITALTAPALQPDGEPLPPASFIVTANEDPVGDDQIIEAAVTDTAGPVELAARLQLSPPAAYRLEGRIKARADVPATVASAIALLGPREADGSTRLALTGSL